MEPVAKGRPRVNINNDKRVRTFTPRKTEIAESIIRIAILQKYEVPPFADTIPLKITATFFLAKPKSANAKRIYPTVKPDLDNFTKTLLDAGNNYLWYDDSQIVSAVINKRYGWPPRIELVLEEEDVF